MSFKRSFCLLLLCASASSLAACADRGASESSSTNTSFQTADGGSDTDGGDEPANAITNENDELVARAVSEYESKPIGQGPEALAWKLDGEAITNVSVGSAKLKVTLPSRIGDQMFNGVRVEAVDRPILAFAITAPTNTLDVGTYVCRDHGGQLVVALANDTVMRTKRGLDSDCTITITKRVVENPELSAHEQALGRPTRTLIVGHASAVVFDAAGTGHAVRAGFALVDSRTER